MASDGVPNEGAEIPCLPPVQRAEPRAAGPTAPVARVPTAADLAAVVADYHRRAARRRRRGNRLVGNLVVLLVLAAVAAAAWAGFVYFENEDTGTSSGSGQPGGLAGVIGGAIDDVDSLNNRYDGMAMLTGEPITLANLTPEEALPTFALAISRSLGPWDGMERHVVNIDDLYKLEPESIGAWLRTLHGLPQDPDVAARAEAEGLLPAPGPGELAIAIRTEGGRVTRLVAVSDDAAVSVDVSA